MTACRFLLMSAVAVLALGSSYVEGQGYKTVVTYLGTDFILPDGCPLSECNQEDRRCRKTRIDEKKKYDDCLATEDGEYPGCVTDVLPSKRKITIPVFANFCSGQCYEKDPEALKLLLRCPHKGNKVDVDEETQRIF